jgi:hypothetical protein
MTLASRSSLLFGVAVKPSRHARPGTGLRGDAGVSGLFLSLASSSPVTAGLLATALLAVVSLSVELL